MNTGSTFVLRDLLAPVHSGYNLPGDFTVIWGRATSALLLEGLLQGHLAKNDIEMPAKLY